MKEEKKSRNPSIELLRIIMMMQIIFLHISDYGDYTDIAQALGGHTELAYWIIWLMCRCPVYIFIIIMGYFLSTSEITFNKKRILKCYLPMFFYSITIPFIYGILKPNVITTDQYLKAFIPFLSRTWYFMTLYLLVLILSPYLNRMVQGLDRKHFLILIGICFCLFSVWQPLSMLEPFEGIIGIKKILATQGGKSLYDFIYMYLLGAYLRKYHLFRKHDNIQDGSIWSKPYLYLLGFLALGLVNVFIVYSYPDVGIEDVIGYNDNPLVVLQCICIFRTFEKLDLSRFKKLGNAINYISAGNLGVYMIHEHPLIRPLIWEDIFSTDRISFYSEGDYLIKFILIILLVYSICWMLDWCRRMLAFLIKKLFKKEKEVTHDN
ncbi:Surface polysaccharide O-acyltransferase, integral membrane enzyme [Lachnospiraceae bacterium NE2001]|nr:Surface polysaccharide O-acyltransferase, integral membrane enzyme [Lachnospiraceae bacterium NE2001]